MLLILKLGKGQGERCLIVPDRIIRISAMAYCQAKKEQRGVGFLLFVRKMTGKLKMKTNWTVLGFGGVGF